MPTWYWVKPMDGTATEAISWQARVWPALEARLGVV